MKQTPLWQASLLPPCLVHSEWIELLWDGREEDFGMSTWTGLGGRWGGPVSSWLRMAEKFEEFISWGCLGCPFGTFGHSLPPPDNTSFSH